MKIRYLAIDYLKETEGAPPAKLLKFCRWCLSGSYNVIGLAALASIFAGITETLTAALMGYILDLVLENSPSVLLSENLIFLIITVSFLFGARPLFFGISAYMQSVILSPGLRTLIATRVHRWTLGHSKSFFENDFAGRVAQKEVQAATALTDVVVESIHTVLFALTSVIAAVAIIGMIDWRIGLVVLFWFAGFTLVMRFFMPRIKAKATNTANAQAIATGQIVDTISNINIVKLFANSRHEDTAAVKAFRHLNNMLTTYGGELVWFRTVMMVYASFVFAGVFAFAISLWFQGRISPGEIVAAGSVSMRLTMMAGWVGFSLMTIYTKLGEVEDAMNTLAVPQTMRDTKNASQLCVPFGKIHFKNVSFSYGQDVGGIDQISLSINPGEKLGVVGASGAGKSTLVSLLLRLHDPESGEIFIDGKNITEVTQDSLRCQIGMVSQETSMFNRSAIENIIYGKPNACFEEVLSASIKAGAHDFIQDLVDSSGRRGYEAFLGERGVKLSGGQRQRIALARAIIKDAPILVLDEATSALDSEVEAIIQTALQQVMEGKTVLAIAHRLSTIASMDRIVVLEKGRIIEQGSHDILLQRNGVYSNFWNRQSGLFIGSKAAAE